MYRFFELITRPLLEAVAARVVVEIGSDEGPGTERLAEYCQAVGGRLHAIDPAPKFDVAEWHARWPNVLELHRGLSLNVLANLPEAPDAVLIDGDHNWYTVTRELDLLESLADEHARPFPLTLIHDVGWPYGRRDLYYDPATIPDTHRHPYKQGGLQPGSAELLDRGFNAHLNNAIHEGTPRNGVRTALEDFLGSTARPLDVVFFPGLHGLAVLYEPGDRQVADAVREMSSGEFLRDLVELVEHDRLQRLAHIARLRADVRELTEQRTSMRASKDEAERLARNLRQEVTAAGEEAASLARRVALLEKRQELALAQHRERVRAKDGQIERLRAAVAEAEKERAKGRSLEREVRRLRQDLARLRNRRSVRVALGVASLARPAFRLRRGQVGRRPERASGAPAASPSSHTQAMPSTWSADAEADVIVCVHNALDDVRRCLASVVACTNLVRHRLIVVDDGSDAETRDFLIDFAANNDAVLLRSETASGYSRAANRGIAASGAPYVVLLNSDAIVTDGWLEAMLACAMQEEGTGVVGPLSNAGTWQSVPRLFDADGSWAVNPLPPGQTPDEVAAAIRQQGVRLHPQVPLVNGFCFLFSRQLLESVGGLDEESFPMGYGEEDDFCLRASSAGYRHRIADDVYVFHAKSKSYTPERRLPIVEKSKVRLREKHGKERIRSAVEELRYGDEIVRARTAASLIVEGMAVTPKEVPGIQGWRVAWVQPHLREVGGIRRTIEMSNRLSAWGAEVTIITPTGEPPDWLPLRANVVSTDEAIRSESHHVLIVSDPDCADLARKIPHESLVVFHLAAYSLYRDLDARLETYAGLPADLHVANSSWTAEQVEQTLGLPVQGIVPGGVDRGLFRPVRRAVNADVVCYGSRRPHKGTPTVEEAARGLRLATLAGKELAQRDLAGAICEARVFASGAWHEGFNLPPLEAMACGVPVAMTDDGGSRDYAKDGENALVVPANDPAALREAIDRLLVEPELRAGLIEKGMRTAAMYSWERATRDLVDAIHVCMPSN